MDFQKYNIKEKKKKEKKEKKEKKKKKKTKPQELLNYNTTTTTKRLYTAFASKIGSFFLEVIVAYKNKN